MSFFKTAECKDDYHEYLRTSMLPDPRAFEPVVTVRSHAINPEDKDCKDASAVDFYQSNSHATPHQRTNTTTAPRAPRR